MRFWKYLVLATGLAGVAGFFAPLIEYRAPDGTLSGASAYEIATGHIEVSPLMKKAEEMGMVSHEEAKKAAHALEKGVYAYRGAMIAFFAPAALLALIGLIEFARKKMGRIAGFLSIILGLACAGVWILMFREPSPDQASGSVGLGLYLLLLAGIGGVVGGLGSLIWPDRATAS